MRKPSVHFVIVILFWCTTFSLLYGQEASVKGLITERTGDTLTLKTETGSQVVRLTDSTKVQSPKGLGLRKEQMSWANLVPGLKVNVKGESTSEGKFEAKTISFSKGDLQTASMIQAGLAPTQGQVAANSSDIAANKQAIDTNASGVAANKQAIEANQDAVSKRFSSLADYEVKDQAVVYFDSGKSTITAEDKAALSKLATGAASLSGYLIEVMGFADSTGNAAANQSLSRERAFAVVDYLMQDCSVPPRHIVSPGAMGISNPVASNETTQGRSQNRRVEVKVMVNKGVSSGS